MLVPVFPMSHLIFSAADFQWLRQKENDLLVASTGPRHNQAESQHADHQGKGAKHTMLPLPK